MATLWTFGDSMTAGYTEGSGWADKYIEWKGYKPKIYPEIISDKLGMELKNLAKGGYDNYSIFETLCANVFVRCNMMYIYIYISDSLNQFISSCKRDCCG